MNRGDGRVAFAALIAAYHDSEDEDGALRALLPLSGRTVLEHQVRRAIDAGAQHAVVLVERVPAGLTDAIERLRRDRIAVEISRDPADAADRFHAEEKILLVADGLIAAPAWYEAMAAQSAPAVLTVPDLPENAGFERIDAERRWAGLALTDRRTLAETADMLGDWDMQSTLMRRIVQAGPHSVGAGDMHADPGDDASPRLADRAAEAKAASRALLAGAEPAGRTWPERLFYAPVAKLLTPPLLDRSEEATWPRVASLLCALIGAAGLWFGWLWTGLVFLLVSGPLSAIAARIDLAHLRYPERHWEPRFGRGIALGLAVVALGKHLAETTGEWIHFFAAAVAVISLLLALRERRSARRAAGGAAPFEGWLAGLEPALWLLVPFAAVGWWEYWAPALGAYAAFSVFFWQDRVAAALQQGEAAARRQD